jgi:hypothetical protein
MGLGVGRVVAFLFGRKNYKNAYRVGFEYADKMMKANPGGARRRLTVDQLMQEAYLCEKTGNTSAKARAEGIYEALADYRQEFPRKGD